MFAVCHKENSQLQNDCQIQNDSLSSLKIFVSSFPPLICLQGRMVSSTQHKHREKKIKIGSECALQNYFKMDRGDRENKEPEKLAEAVFCEAIASDLHDVLGSHQLSVDSALAF